MILKKTNKKGNGRGIQWLRAILDGPREDCLFWPFNKSNGYGVFGLNGEILYAHRWVCEQTRGPCPSKSYEAAHSCGNGHRGCVNPSHISWKTKSQNQSDRAAHGRKSTGRRGKITKDDARQILSLKGEMTQAEIAKKFNTSRANVSLIHCGKAWTRHQYRGYQKVGNRYYARITVNHTSRRLGVFDTAAEAHAAFNRANEKARLGISD
jgi:hypothetical protein